MAGGLLRGRFHGDGRIFDRTEYGDLVTENEGGSNYFSLATHPLTGEVQGVKRISRPSLVDHVHARLREDIRAGQLTGKLPGVCTLAGEYGVSHGTLRAGLLRLEREGMLKSGGDGRSRRVVARKPVAAKRKMCVTVLLNERLEEEYTGFRFLMLQLHRELQAAGHGFRFAHKTQRDLKNDLGRIKRYVASQATDIWVVVGATKEILTWFAGQNVPAIALGGDCRTVPIASAGRDIRDALREACRHLVKMDHQRIVLLGSRTIRNPESLLYQVFASELAAGGVTLGNYNLPECDETPAGTYALLDSLFRLTPPTAIIVAQSTLLVATLAFLAQRKLLVPTDVSVICMTYDVMPGWHRPMIAHFSSDESALVERIVGWVNAVVSGSADSERVLCNSVFVPGESIGPARNRNPVAQ